MTQTDESLERLNAIGVLTRREIEARLLGPLIEALGAKFGRQEVIEVVRETIIQIAHQQGGELARSAGGCGLQAFAATLEAWKKNDAMQFDILEQNEHHFDFNVRRCRYAEMYAALGLQEIGEVLSCNRDGALIAGFNPEIHLERTQTLMQGAAFCDFRYTYKEIKE